MARCLRMQILETELNIFTEFDDKNIGILSTNFCITHYDLEVQILSFWSEKILETF